MARGLVLPTSNAIFLLINLLRVVYINKNNEYDQISYHAKMIYENKLISAGFVSYNNEGLSWYIDYEITAPLHIK